MGKILVLAEHMNGELKTPSLAGITFAKQVCAAQGCGFDVLLIGAGVDAAAQEVAKYGAEKVYKVEGPAFQNYLAQSWAHVVHEVASQSGAQIIVTISSTTGKDCFPRVAAKFEAGMASEVVGLGEGGTYMRPTWAGNVLESVKINTAVHVMTVRPTEFDKPEPAGASPVEAFSSSFDPSTIKQHFVDFKATVSSRPDLSEANVVIAGGRGLKSKENFKIVEDLADLLGGAVGATRAAVDAEYIENDYQIGQTGKVCAPDLYIGAGISGAIQHLAGMKASKVIVAVNKDEEAPIFSVADYGVVGDLLKVLPELTNKIKQHKGL